MSDGGGKKSTNRWTVYIYKGYIRRRKVIRCDIILTLYI